MCICTGRMHQCVYVQDVCVIVCMYACRPVYACVYALVYILALRKRICVNKLCFFYMHVRMHACHVKLEIPRGDRFT